MDNKTLTPTEVLQALIDGKSLVDGYGGVLEVGMFSFLRYKDRNGRIDSISLSGFNYLYKRDIAIEPVIGDTMIDSNGNVSTVHLVGCDVVVFHYEDKRSSDAKRLRVKTLEDWKEYINVHRQGLPPAKFILVDK